MLTAFNLGALLLEAPLASLSDHFNRRTVLMVAVFLSMSCAVYLPIAIYDELQRLSLLFLWGGVVGGMYSISLSMTGDQFRHESSTSANAAYSFMENAGGVIGPLLIGFTMQSFDSDGLPYAILLILIAYFLFALTRYEMV
jgi:MFS family permease